MLMLNCLPHYRNRIVFIYHNIHTYNTYSAEGSHIKTCYFAPHQQPILSKISLLSCGVIDKLNV